MNNDHYAVLVGLSQYPNLGEPPPSNLSGPANDVEAVRAWLVDPAGGALPPANVTSITSPDEPDPLGAPGRDDIQRAFKALAAQAEQKRGGLGAQLGRRIYLYASGHGFSPTLNQGCLHAGDATSMSSGENVFFTAWLELFQEAGYFKETVLWMDCCMNRDSRNAPSLPTLQPKISPDPAGPSFVALAARRPLRAVERPEPDGKVHGIFTTILLEGLRGAAANPYGMVTGRSLADWLRNAQRGRVDGPDLDDPRVSKEPEILREDQELIFARGLPVTTYPVTLDFPGGANGVARLWSGRPPRSQTLTLDAQGKVSLPLAPGMYVADLAAKQLRQGFQVTAPLALKIDKPGAPVAATEQMASFTIAPGDPGAEIFIIDEAFNLVDRGVDSLETKLPFGIYKVRVRAGRRMSEEIHLLDHAPAPAQASAALAPFTSAAPLPNTAFVHEYHEGALKDAAGRIDLAAGAGGELLVMVRQWRSDDAEPSPFRPWAGVRIVNRAGRTIADLASDGKRNTQGDPWATVSIGVEPGDYFLRMRDEDGAELEQSVIVSPGWRTDVYALSGPRTDETRDDVRLRLSMLMHPQGSPATAPIDVMIDQARVALADERLVLGGELDDLLLAKFDNPIAGILGGHLLLIEQARRPSARIGLLDNVVTNLRGLVGERHPDVEALSLRCVKRNLRSRLPFETPPIFHASWKLMVDAGQTGSELIPAALWKRVHALSPVSPFMVWSSDRKSKANSREAILANLMPAVPVAKAAVNVAAAFLPAGLGAIAAGVIGTGAAAYIGKAKLKNTLAEDLAAVKETGAGSSRSAAARELRSRLAALGLTASALDAL